MYSMNVSDLSIFLTNVPHHAFVPEVTAFLAVSERLKTL
jgi:hypothetical protein